MSVRERDPFLCAAGSFFFPGLGQVYCGKILRGILFLVPAVLLHVPYPFIYLAAFFQSDYYATLLTYWSSLLPLVLQLVDLVVRAAATWDAYRIAKSTQVAVTLQPPGS